MCSKKHRYKGKCIHCELTQLKADYADLKMTNKNLIKANINLVDELSKCRGGK